MSGIITSVNLATTKGVKKHPVNIAELIAGYGIHGDAHAGSDRQISLLAEEDITRATLRINAQFAPGDFGENLTIKGIAHEELQIGHRFAVGEMALLQISKIGKICHEPCDIGRRLGTCIMPSAGVFAHVIRGGHVTPGDAMTPVTVYTGAVLAASDRCACGERDDASGPLLVKLLEELGIIVTEYCVMPDDEAPLSEKLCFLADRCAVDIVLTTGGTGLSIRDRMPEATLAVLQQQAPGFAEAIRAEGLRHTPLAVISRGTSGLRGRTLIINLPGSNRAIDEISPFLFSALPHCLESLRMEVADCGTMQRPQSTIHL
ncbi:MAG TPA: molybdopterin-binding protein [Armatimonadota bacterium]|nr:molybdopterin-binding protein [Armatimonadota bacterium]